MQAEGLKDVDELQSYLIHRIERFLNAHGRKLLGWDEILDGGLAPNATVMSWRGVEGACRPSAQATGRSSRPGSSATSTIRRMPPSRSPRRSAAIRPCARFTPFEPVSEEMTPEEERLLLGVQANLWAEWIPTDAHYEYMMWPRLMAPAEVGWGEPSRTQVLRRVPRPGP